MKKVLSFLSVILGIFFIVVFYENYFPHNRTSVKYIVNDTCLVDSVKVDTAKSEEE